MRLDLARLGLRQQWLGLFGLFLATGVLLLALDQLGQWLVRQSLQQIRSDVLAEMADLRRLAEAYRGGVVDTTVKARNALLERAQARARLEDARAQIDAGWRALQARPLQGEEASLRARALQSRARADAAAAVILRALENDDLRAQAQFIDHELYPAVDPLTADLQQLAALAQQRADAQAERALRLARWLGWLQVAVVAASLLLLAWVGRRIVRNGYRGVETLVELARRMQAHDYAAQPRYRASGELGEVLDSFLRLRAHVQRMEQQLTEQLRQTDRVREALERREHFQRLLLEAAPTAILAVDADGVFTQVNPFAEQLLGWPAATLVGRERLDRILDPEALAALAAALSEAYAQPVAADWTALRALALHHEAPREFALRHQRGRRLPVQLALAAMRDDTGALVGLLAVATDLTATKRLEHALRDSEARAHEANRAKSAFLAAMSHEIRTPMIGVTGMLEILAHTPLDAEQRQALNVVQASAQTLLRIIGDILDFSKIEAGRLEIEPVPTALPELVRSVTASHAGSASSKGLGLRCEIDPRIGPAHYADPVRLRQILGNFLSNAIKFTREGGVQVALEWRGEDPAQGALGADRLVFRVTDSGIGISPEAQARLFQPFAQAEADTTRRFGGTGLGLAISRRLAELMGGTVEMESVPGIGTTLRLHLALARAPAEELPQASLPGDGRGGFRPRRLPTVAEAEQAGRLVLLVDDHPTNRQVIQRQLALAGYAAETAEDGREGLQRWRSGRYGLVLTDVHMPHMDGYQLARAIREEEARGGRARTPIVALTASALKGEAERCLGAGMDDYMAKPVGLQALDACLRRWLPLPDADAAALAEPAAALPQLAQPPPLDPAVLDALTGGDAGEVRALLGDFLASCDDDLAQAQALRSGGDLPGLARQAHKLKGAARLVGAQELAQAAERLEAAAREAAWDRVLPAASDVETALERLRLHVAARWPG